MKKILFTLRLLGVLIICGGLAMSYDSLRLLCFGKTGLGDVVEIVSSTSTSRDSKTGINKISVFYYPVVTYQTQDGKSATFTSSFGRSSPYYTPGSPVEVLYLPEAPEKAKIKQVPELAFAPFMMFIFGGCWFLIAYILNRCFPKDPEEIFSSEALRAFGQPVSAEIVDIVQANTGQDAPWIIHAKWQDPKSGKTYKFSSKPVPADPRGKVGGTINVNILPDKPHIYDVDIAVLMK